MNFSRSTIALKRSILAQKQKREREKGNLIGFQHNYKSRDSTQEQ